MQVVMLTLPHLALQCPDAHILLVKLLLLESDPLHQIVNAFVLTLQHQLREKPTQKNQMFSFWSSLLHSACAYNVALSFTATEVTR